ncbi:hypothetical protein OA2633_08909 [Oceanicaulis sp. HTCC2633]|nr:hypothetical protein OA2633_08909 [Oceanicaulis sp. HTCC2633]
MAPALSSDSSAQALRPDTMMAGRLGSLGKLTEIDSRIASSLHIQASKLGIELQRGRGAERHASAHEMLCMAQPTPVILTGCKAEQGQVEMIARTGAIA